MADLPPVVSVAKAKWQQLVPVSMELDADLIDIWAADAGGQDGGGDGQVAGE
jgi:hypothetical protein